MARKKRQALTQPTTPAGQLPQDKPVKAAYQDEFQRNINKKIESAGKKFEGKGKNILYGLAAVAVLALLIGIFYVYNRRSNAQAQSALGKAIETASAQVTDSPQPGSIAKTFKTEKERSEAAIAEFQAVADKFGGEVGDKAKYFVAVNKLKIDRAAAVSELDALSSKSGEVGKLAKFALAQAKTGDGDLDRAAALYQELAKMDDSVLAKDTINFNLAQVLEKQGKKAEAADIYFNIAKAASEAKDLDGKPVTLSQTAREAKEKLTELNPEKAKELPEPALPQMPQMPFGS
jgi:tetratricopeptide (TPR) repeat protein